MHSGDRPVRARPERRENIPPGNETLALTKFRSEPHLMRTRAGSKTGLCAASIYVFFPFASVSSLYGRTHFSYARPAL
jgi:hypothetical protein